ncbi:hypothetical protein ACXZ7E_22955 [Paenibacillus lautus]
MDLKYTIFLLIGLIGFFASLSLGTLALEKQNGLHKKHFIVAGISIILYFLASYELWNEA